MQIKVRSLQGDEFIVQVREDQLVSSLKASISEQPNGPAVERQKLIYKGRTMQDSVLLAEYRLEDDCKVHLIIQKETQPTSGQHEPSTTGSSSASSRTNDPAATPTTTTATSPPSKRSPGSPHPMDISSSSSSSQDDKPTSCGNQTSGGQTLITGNIGSSGGGNNSSGGASDNNNYSKRAPPSRFEEILRERLAHHFPSNSVDKIMANLYHEIDEDINASSLDDLERLAKQKLNITNE